MIYTWSLTIQFREYFLKLSTLTNCKLILPRLLFLIFCMYDVLCIVFVWNMLPLSLGPDYKWDLSEQFPKFTLTIKNKDKMNLLPGDVNSKNNRNKTLEHLILSPDLIRPDLAAEFCCFQSMKNNMWVQHMVFCSFLLFLLSLKPMTIRGKTEIMTENRPSLKKWIQ